MVVPHSCSLRKTNYREHEYCSSRSQIGAIIAYLGYKGKPIDKIKFMISLSPILSGRGLAVEMLITLPTRPFSAPDMR
jgi:hypothetical protein